MNFVCNLFAKKLNVYKNQYETLVNKEIFQCKQLEYSN